MTEAERIDLLIKTVAHDNAATFAKKTNMSPSSLCKKRLGKLGVTTRNIDDIMRADPYLNREWLETGEGYPGDLSIELVRDHFQSQLNRANLIIDHLLKRVEELEKGQNA